MRLCTESVATALVFPFGPSMFMSALHLPRTNCTALLIPLPISRVTVIEAKELLGTFDGSLREYAARKLVAQGVKLRRVRVGVCVAVACALSAMPCCGAAISLPVMFLILYDHNIAGSARVVCNLYASDCWPVVPTWQQLDAGKNIVLPSALPCKPCPCKPCCCDRAWSSVWRRAASP